MAKTPDDKETFRIPRDASRILTQLTAKISLDTGARVTKTDILVGLLGLLEKAKINTKQVQNAEDVIDQVKEQIRKNVK